MLEKLYFIKDMTDANRAPLGKNGKPCGTIEAALEYGYETYEEAKTARDALNEAGGRYKVTSLQNVVV